jgi:hypothetical protein
MNRRHREINVEADVAIYASRFRMNVLGAVWSSVVSLEPGRLSTWEWKTGIGMTGFGGAT